MKEKSRKIREFDAQFGETEAYTHALYSTQYHLLKTCYKPSFHSLSHNICCMCAVSSSSSSASISFYVHRSFISFHRSAGLMCVRVCVHTVKLHAVCDMHTEVCRMEVAVWVVGYKLVRSHHNTPVALQVCVFVSILFLVSMHLISLPLFTACFTIIFF